MQTGIGNRSSIAQLDIRDRKSTRLNSSHGYISYAVFCLKKKKDTHNPPTLHNQDHAPSVPITHHPNATKRRCTYAPAYNHPTAATIPHAYATALAAQLSL